MKKNRHTQIYRGYEIRIEYEINGNGHNVFLTSKSYNIEPIQDVKIFENIPTCKKAYKCVHKFIDKILESEEELVFDRNGIVIYLKQLIDTKWQYRVVSKYETLVNKSITREAAILDATDTIVTLWYQIAQYFGSRIFMRFLKEKGQYQCRIHDTIFNEMFDDDVSLIGFAFKKIEQIL